MTEQITTHSEDAKARLLLQYKGKPKLSALIDALFGQQIQDLEDAAFSLYGRLDIDNNEGLQLDGIGGIIGIERAGYSDTLYKYILKAKTGQINSHGSIEEIINIYKLLTQAGRVQLQENYPAEIDLYSDEPVDLQIADLIRELMQGAAAGGVQVYVLAIVYSETNAFGFDGDDATVGGFGDYDDSEVGGEFAYIQLM